MKLTETMNKLYDDLAKCGENEIAEITFAGMTWKLEVKTILKIIQYAYAWITKGNNI